MMENEADARDFPFKIKVQQSAKGFSYWEVSVKTDKIDDLKQKLDECVEIAKTKCEDLNKIIPVNETGKLM